MTSPPVVGIASWLVPGAGYWLIGQRARALATGLTIIALFVAGLLIGGVRLVEVAGWGDHGRKLMVYTRDRGTDAEGRKLVSETTAESGQPDETDGTWVMEAHPLDEIRNKPWAIAQILTGPIDIAAAAASVAASHDEPGTSIPIGARSHSRTNELGVLYTAVAGMLNLLVILDSSHRAARLAEEAK